MKRKFSSCCLGCLLYGGLTVLVLALPVWYFCIYVLPLVVSEATTRLTAPLTADGQIDYFKAWEERIYPPEFTTDENGFRILVRQFGDHHIEYGGYREDREFYRQQMYEKLGLDPDTPPTLTFPREPKQVLWDYYKAKEESVPENQQRYDRNWSRPWTLEEYPMFADWIEKIDEPLDAIAEVIRKPFFLAPLLKTSWSAEDLLEAPWLEKEPQDLVSVPEWPYDRDMFAAIRKNFLARANYRIGTGNIDGAIDDKLTLSRLGRQITQKRFRIYYLTGTWTETTAAMIPVGANPEHPLTETQIRRILDGLDTLPLRVPLAEVYEGERLRVLSYAGLVSRVPTPFFGMFWLSTNGSEIAFWTRFGTLSDHNALCRRINELYDSVQEPPPREKYRAIQKTIKTPESWTYFFRVLTSSGRGTLLADIAIKNTLVDEINHIEEAFHRAECSENMQRLALAILLYQYEHGKMPDENWAEQIAKYLGENPERYFACPENPIPKGTTRYALVQYDKLPENPDTILVIELTEPVPLDEAVVTVNEVLEEYRRDDLWQRGGRLRLVSLWGLSHDMRQIDNLHAAYRSGAVRSMGWISDDKELLRMLGREEESE